MGFLLQVWLFVLAVEKGVMKPPINSDTLIKLLKNVITTDIDSREMFMKGIDYSYYYEEE